MMNSLLRLVFSLGTAAIIILAACSRLPGRESAPTDIPTQPRPQSAPTPAGRVSGQRGEQIDRAIRRDHPLFSGVVLVARQGEVLLSQGYKWANWELEVPNTAVTKFRIASITKPFTALAILMLQERGLLDVQDSVCKYLQQCPAAWQAITLHDLLIHTSGIPEYTKLPHALEDARSAHSASDLVASFRDEPLEFTPGERFVYSNSGYVLLGYIIEHVSGEAYAGFLTKNIWLPLGMKNSGFDYNLIVLKGRAAGYTIEGGRLLNASYLDMTNAYAAGGLYSTVDDLYRWEQALYTEQLVSRETQMAMFTPYIDAPQYGGSYGYGWVLTESGGRQIEAHEGSVPGFHTYLARYPDDQATIIVLSNVETEDVKALAREIEGMLFSGQ